MENHRTATVLICIVILLLCTECIADNPTETENPRNDNSGEEGADAQKDIQPKDVSVENLGENNHTLDITVTDTENETTIYSDNLTLPPKSETVVEEVTSKEGEYNVTVLTEDGLREYFLWRVYRDHHDLEIDYHNNNLQITQNVN